MTNGMHKPLKRKPEESAAATACSKVKALALVGADILLFMVLMGGMLTLASLLFPGVFGESAIREMTADSFRMMVYEASMLGMTLLAVWFIVSLRGTKLSALGFSLRGHRADWINAFLLVASMYGIGFLVGILSGSIQVVAVSFDLLSLLVGLLSFFLVAVFEEVMLRGFVLKRMLDVGLNKFLALLLSSALFSLMHFMNPGFAFLPFVNILLAGVFLGASYIYTRNLCLPIALHWYWNWMQGSVLGYEVSGNRLDSTLLKLSTPEADWINGGSFGFEGSLLCTLLLIAGAGLIIASYERRSSNN